MQISVQHITPEIAAQMLAKNTLNRPLSDKHIAKLAREMVMGHWQTNGDTIRFNGERLLDGQHRLAAVIKSGVPIDTIVVEGLESESFVTIDAGKPRNAADALALHGETNTKHLASVLRLIERYRAKRMIEKPEYTTSDVMDFMVSYPTARRSVAVCKMWSNQRNLAPISVMGACHFLFAQKDSAAADTFIEQLRRGVSLEEDNPVHLLRERLIDNAQANKKLSSVHLMALTIKAWNAQRKGEKLHNLRWREGGPVPEQFPVVI